MNQLMTEEQLHQHSGGENLEVMREARKDNGYFRSLIRECSGDARSAQDLAPLSGHSAADSIFPMSRSVVLSRINLTKISWLKMAKSESRVSVVHTIVANTWQESIAGSIQTR